MASQSCDPPGLFRGLASCWRQWRVERQLSRRGIHFRSTDLNELARAYAAMSGAEFEAINGRQDWANWRTIPRALAGRLPQRPLRVLDLGCGTGSSTTVLAWCCPSGSRIIGYELAEPLISIARRRQYRHGDGMPANVDFRCQGVTETLCGTDGTPLPDRQVDLINASGVVGHHLNETSIQPLLAEVQRLLGDDGIVTLDVGPTLDRPTLSRLLEQAGLAYLGHARSWWFDPTGQLTFRRQPVTS